MGAEGSRVSGGTFLALTTGRFSLLRVSLICFGVGASVQTDSFETQVQGLLSDLVDWLPEWWEHVRRCSDGFLLDVVRSEVSGLIPHLFGCCLKGGSTWEASIAEFLERQLASNGFLLDVVGSEGQVARGRGWASFGTGLFTACFSPV